MTTTVSYSREGPSGGIVYYHLIIYEIQLPKLFDRERMVTILGHREESKGLYEKDG